MKARTYLIVQASLVLTALAAVGTFNLAVDPYSIYNAVSRPGFNAVKPEVTKHLRMAKAKSVSWTNPDALILGSSTAETGLDPAGVPATRSAYNLGLSGANIYEVRRYYQHARSTGRIKRVILVVDLFMFNANLPNRPDFDERVLNVNADGAPNRQISKLNLATLFSLDTTRASLATLQGQEQPNAFLPNGQLEWNYRSSHIQKFGYGGAFAYAETFIRDGSFLPPPARAFSFTRADGYDSIAELARIMDMASQDGADLTVVISPSHARLLESMQQLGLWNIFEDWKRRIVRTAEKMSERKITIVDFSGYNSVTTEAVPPVDDKASVMHNYWDDFHFKKEIGDRILERIAKGPTPAVNDTFGVALTKANLDGHLARIRTERDQWRATHGDDIAGVTRNLAHATSE
ncbi:hypothetical protein [Achromobacter ruhlandii]|uniref:hypothetical protein n=1 Tax=Achromobacter ruhlandii TaxID=72557 RepID=UPI003018CBF3